MPVEDREEEDMAEDANDEDEEEDEDGEYDLEEEEEMEAEPAPYTLASKEENPSDSDHDYKYEDDDCEDMGPPPLPSNKQPAMFEVSDDMKDFDELRPMLLYDVRAAFPKTVVSTNMTYLRAMQLTSNKQRWRARNLVKAIDEDARDLNLPEDAYWIESYTSAEWANKPLEEIEKSMDRGHVFVIRNTTLNEGWDFDMRSATKIKTGTAPAEVQGMSIIQCLRAYAQL